MPEDEDMEFLSDEDAAALADELLGIDPDIQGQQEGQVSAVVDGPEAPAGGKFTKSDAQEARTELQTTRVDLSKTRGTDEPIAQATHDQGTITVSFGSVLRDTEGKKSITLVLDPPDYPIITFKGPLVTGADMAHFRRALLLGFRLYQRELRNPVHS